jgi:diguanylate cyclase (GGDEF)-like protein
VSTLVFAFPVLSLTYLQLDSVRTGEATLARESAGIVRLQAGARLLAAVSDARREPGDAADRRVAGAIADLEAFEAGRGGPALRAASQKLHEAWLGAHDERARELTERAAGELMVLAEEDASFTYDPRADVSNLSDEAAARLPVVLTRLEEAAYRTETAGRSGSAAEEQSAVAALTADAVTALGIARDERRLAAEANPSVTRALESPDAAFDAAVAKLVAGLSDFSQGRASGASSAGVLRANIEALRRAGDAAFAARTDLLGRIFLERGIELDGQKTSVIFYAAVAMIGSVGILFFLARILLYRTRRHYVEQRERARALESELALQNAERARMLTDAQFRAIFERSPLGIATLDRTGAIVECNPRFIEIAGDRVPLVAAWDMARIVSGELKAYEDERPLERSDGSEVWIAVSVSPVMAEDTSIVAIAMVADATERRLLSDRLRYQATHDALTALPGRELFVDRVDAALANRREPDRSIAVMLLDLDRFKLVNDTLGHAAGDRFLIAVGQRLAGAVRPRDLVARFHGDEFAILLPDIEQFQVLMICERIQRLMRTPLTIDGKRIQGGVSIGIALARPQDTAANAKDAAELLREADAALYRAKAAGRGRGILFNDDVRASFERRTRLANDLREGIPEEHLILRYQPIVRIDDGSPAAYEVLATWNHPELGEITPSEFIPIAEESDAIVVFGATVLRQACRRLEVWSRTIPGASDLMLNVNLSGRQVLDEALIDDVLAAVKECDLPPERIMFEVTENVLLDGDPVIADRLHGLKALGFGLCLDDFGIGYSSLRYLHQFPFDMLKIDRSFVSSEDGALSNEPIVTMLITLAETLGLQLVAEGIEHPAQRQRLHSLGCVLGQGFLFGRGMPIPEATEWLRARARARAPVQYVLR